MAHALRSGILAAYAASDMLDGHAERARWRYRTMTQTAFAGYVPALRTLYAAAPWDTPFWQRRAERHLTGQVAAAASPWMTAVRACAGAGRGFVDDLRAWQVVGQRADLCWPHGRV